ncbi:winged helix-turn-helix transcriptional regulator [Aestuariivirga sp.]|uniref:winged helix-turn-helix transcriptional regulator n=1 Tax=Aestuariivirga sp. TaxID=2650926 RepID=UPI0035AF5C81
MSKPVTLPGTHAGSPKPTGAAQDGTRPVIDAVSRLGRKWTLQVMRCLASGQTRFSGLQRQLPGLSSYMLARTLRDLERDGLVARTVLSPQPPRIAYHLTPIGATLVDSLEALTSWAERCGERIEAARAEFDRRSRT